MHNDRSDPANSSGLSERKAYPNKNQYGSAVPESAAKNVFTVRERKRFIPNKKGRTKYSNGGKTMLPALRKKKELNVFPILFSFS